LNPISAPEICERIARSIGTHQVRELTVRRKEGPLLTSLATGDASSKMVEAYRLHPNAIKALAMGGRGVAATHVLFGQTATALDTTPARA
jgi:hypothetical protein